MTELYLKFVNSNGEEERVLVEGEKYVIGRHSENDLSIVNAKLSRKHIKIERFADVFVVSDLKSSNGTKLNDKNISDPESLKNGDKLNLGGGIELQVEIISDNPYLANGSSAASSGASESDEEDFEDSVSPNSANSGVSTKSVSNQGGGSSGSGLKFFFILAPLMGLAIILVIGGALFFLSDKGNAEVAKNNDEFIFTSDEDDDFLEDIPENLSSVEDESSSSGNPLPDSTKDETSGTNKPTQNNENSTEVPPNNSSNPTDTNPPPPTPIPQGIETISTPRKVEVKETDKIRGLALSFMKRIAKKDPRPVLTTKQLAVVNAKIKQYKGSGVLAANIKDAKNNASQIQSLANSKNIKPQFLATAALTKLGNQRGNVVATAQGMLEVLDNLNISIGDELANDSLLVIASYNQGVAGKNLAMRDKLAKLANDNPAVSSRQVRTIWFLRDRGEISNQEFELALRFLAIGTITQNPKAFNVNTEALAFN